MSRRISVAMPLALWLCSATAAAQRPAEWRVAERAILEVGGPQLELYRVAGAVILSSGDLAIADAGNSRIVVVSPQGRLVRSIGRSGGGPGEFRGLAKITAIRDTLVAYDASFSRVSVFLPNGTHVQTKSLPPHNDRPVFFQGALSAFQYVAVTPLRTVSQRSGLDRDSIAILLVDASTGRSQHIGTREWQFIYTVIQGRGTTGYGTPFLGQTEVTVARDRIIVVPRARAMVEILGRDQAVRHVELPLRLRPFRREMVIAHRDSLLRLVGRTGSAAERIENAFSDRFPVPEGEHAALIQSVAVVNGGVWLQSVAEAEAAMATWYAVDPVNARATAVIRLPRPWKVLGGDERRVVVLVRDELGVEYVRVYEVTR